MVREAEKSNGSSMIEIERIGRTTLVCREYCKGVSCTSYHARPKRIDFFRSEAAKIPCVMSVRTSVVIAPIYGI